MIKLNGIGAVGRGKRVQKGTIGNENFLQYSQSSEGLQGNTPEPCRVELPTPSWKIKVVFFSVGNLHRISRYFQIVANRFTI